MRDHTDIALRDAYIAAVSGRSDVKDHLPTFVAEVLLRDSPVVVELGSRGGVSTTAWLYATRLTNGTLWTVDLSPAPRIIDGYDLSDTWTHVQGHDTHPDDGVADRIPDSIDVLYVDTVHDYDQCSAELGLYGPRVRWGGVILLHDADLQRPWEYDAACPVQADWPIRRAVRDWCATRRLAWSIDPGSYGLARIDLPLIVG